MVETPKKLAPTSQDERLSFSFKVKLGELTFHTQKGEILSDPEPVIKSSSRQHSQVEFFLVDSSADLWTKIKSHEGSEASIEIGYAPDHLETVVTGKAYWIGRKMGDSIIIRIVDNAYAANNSTGSSIISSDAPAPPVTPTPATASTTSTTTPTAGNATSAASNPAVPADPNVNTLAQAATIATGGKPKESAVQQVVVTAGLNFQSDTVGKETTKGQVQSLNSPLKTAVKDAAAKGEVIVADGATVKQVGPGQGASSGVTIDWVKHQSAFIHRPTVLKKTPFQLQSGGGALTVSGWNPNDKGMVGATIVSELPAGTHPTGVIAVPNWNQIKLGDPIFPGCPYTWADATKNGTRVPEGKDVVQGIIQIAQLITPLTQQTTRTTKWQINSWYRDPTTNSRVSSSGRAGPHTTGTAVDFWFPGQGLIELYKRLDREHDGGIAIHPAVYEGAGFVHIDLIGITIPGSKRRRWSY